MLIKRILIISHYSKSVVNLRGDLIKNLLELGYEVFVVGPEDDSKEEILALGVKEFFHLVVNRTGANIIHDLKYVLALKKYIESIHPNITLGYSIKPSVYGAIAAKLAGVRSVNSMFTGTGFLFTSRSFKARFLRILSCKLFQYGLKCADRVIFQNRDDLNEFVEEKLVSKGKCYLVNGSGVNMSRFVFTPMPDTITFFMTSRLIYSKGVLEYFEAAKMIKKRYSDVRFVILGAIEKKADSIPFIEVKSYFEEGIVEHLGTTNNVPKFLAESSVYVLPSYREGVPRSVLEAMAMARPILTTDVPGCRETVIDGINGFLVPPRNVDALVEKMIWFIDNKDKLQIMGQKSYDICASKFEVSLINKKMISILKIE